jgi:EpsI family protein
MAQSVRRRARFFVLAVGLIGATALVSSLPGGTSHAPVVATLGAIPTVLPGWRSTDRVPAGVMPSDPSAETELARAYQNGTQTVWVSVGYYPGQGEGRHPAARKLLFPGSGWRNLNEESTRIVVDGRVGGTIPATLVVMETEGRSLAILYWYQIGRHSVASDHGYRALLLVNRLIRRRSDGALVRIASPVPSAREVASVVARQIEFVRVFYPELLRNLPG